MKCKFVFAVIGACLFLVLQTIPSSAQETKRVEPGTYKEREILLDLRKYSTEVERKSIDVPEEQRYITFDQVKEEEYGNLQVALFTVEGTTQEAERESEAEQLALFDEEMDVQSYIAAAEEPTADWLPWIMSAFAAVLVGVLLLVIVPKMNET
ncbi:type VII secretion EssA family protein [Bacillus sp. JCM 19041]|uniref:type VII secretion EssA family protein n=1 Tax=Bacillus sp. JCM 19041 TaxID=1460637 RepID=UPI0006D1F02E